jgi:hypothetical protein
VSEVVADPCSECGHDLAHHADSGWGERTVCTVPLVDPDAGWHGVCPCVRRGDEDLDAPNGT